MAALCAQPLQCAAVHELRTDMSEMNQKLTSVFAMLQMFFDQWKRTESAKSGESTADLVSPAVQNQPEIIPVSVAPPPPPIRQPVPPPARVIPTHKQPKRARYRRPYTHTNLISSRRQFGPVASTSTPSFRAPAPPSISSSQISIPPPDILAASQPPTVSSQSFNRPQPMVSSPVTSTPNPTSSTNHRAEIETIVIKDEPDDEDVKTENTAMPAIETSYGSGNDTWPTSEFSGFDFSPPQASSSQVNPQKRSLPADDVDPWTGASVSDQLNYNDPLAPWNQPSTSGGAAADLQFNTEVPPVISASVIAKAAEAANKAQTLEQRIKKFAWQLVVRTIPVARMWDLMGAVTCSSKDASSAADLLAKQKEPVRTILRITLEQYQIGEEHVGKSPVEMPSFCNNADIPTEPHHV